MISPSIPQRISFLDAPPSSGRHASFRLKWRALRERVLRVPLLGKLLGANLLIAIAGVVTAGAIGQRGLVVFVLAASAISFVVSAKLVRLALEPLDDLERVADAVSRGEDYVRVIKSPVADERVERLGSTINRLLDTVGADRRHIHQLIQRSLGIREAERATLSEKLREKTAQQIYALELHLATTDHAFGAESGRVALRTARAISTQLLHDVRGLADAVYPGLMRELGLHHALLALAVRARNHAKSRVSVDSSAATTHMSPALAVAMYHVAEEGVRNAERHADAPHIRIRLSSTPTELRLEVADDGKGFDVRSLEQERLGVGLFQARELLASVHGKLEIASLPGRGTRLIATARLDQGDTC